MTCTVTHLKQHGASTETFTSHPEAPTGSPVIAIQTGGGSAGQRRPGDETLAKEIAMKWSQLARAGREGRLTETQCRDVITSMYERGVGAPLHFRTARIYLAGMAGNSKTDTMASIHRRYQ